jgi:hypothetical protein
MGLLSTIISKVFGGKKEAAPASSSEGAEAVETVIAEVTPIVPADFDVAGYLHGLRSQTAEKLDWTVSIVDLMKLVGMDSSLTARKELAKELGYPNDTADSAKMNIWLHKQVMQQIAKHGGKLPAELVA